jgi:hypothetical protein
MRPPTVAIVKDSGHWLVCDECMEPETLAFTRASEAIVARHQHEKEKRPHAKS